MNRRLHLARSTARAVVAALAVTTLALAACEKPPAGGVTMILADDERLSFARTDPEMPTADDPARSWESSPWWDGTSMDCRVPESAAWIPYRPTSQVLIEHNLGREPTGVLVYLSFTACGQNPALAAGDLARIASVDERQVTVWNDTNGSYFVRVVVF